MIIISVFYLKFNTFYPGFSSLDRSKNHKKDIQGFWGQTNVEP